VYIREIGRKEGSGAFALVCREAAISVKNRTVGRREETEEKIKTTTGTVV
jgi:hypothetical protein